MIDDDEQMSSFQQNKTYKSDWAKRVEQEFAASAQQIDRHVTVRSSTAMDGKLRGEKQKQMNLRPNSGPPNLTRLMNRSIQQSNQRSKRVNTSPFENDRDPKVQDRKTTPHNSFNVPKGTVKKKRDIFDEMNISPPSDSDFIESDQNYTDHEGRYDSDQFQVVRSRGWKGGSRLSRKKKH